MKMLPTIGIQLYCISDIYFFNISLIQNDNDINEGFVWFIMNFSRAVDIIQPINYEIYFFRFFSAARVVTYVRT